jgi:hypothetical protein
MFLGTRLWRREHESSDVADVAAHCWVALDCVREGEIMTVCGVPEVSREFESRNVDTKNIQGTFPHTTAPDTVILGTFLLSWLRRRLNFSKSVALSLHACERGKTRKPHSDDGCMFVGNTTLHWLALLLASLGRCAHCTRTRDTILLIHDPDEASCLQELNSKLEIR